MKPKGEGPVGSVISDPVLLDRYVAIADYVKQETNHCSLEAGQVVEVVEKNQHGGWVQHGGWWGGSSVVGGEGREACYHELQSVLMLCNPSSNCVPHSLPPIVVFTPSLHLCSSLPLSNCGLHSPSPIVVSLPPSNCVLLCRIT